MATGMKVTVAEYVLYQCDTQHNKHIGVKFSYVKREPLRSCAFCVDAVEGLTDWELELLKDVKFGYPTSERHAMAANVRDIALAAVK